MINLKSKMSIIKLVEDLKYSSQPFLIVGSNTEQNSNLAEEIIGKLGITKSDTIIFKAADSQVQVRDIREINSQFYLKPHSSQYRIFIIFDTNELNQESANTLLKTLEEPPSYGRIILFSDSIQKIIPTIKSRCKKVFLDHQEVNERKGILNLLERGNFAQYLEEVKNYENEEIAEILENTLEELKKIGLNDDNKKLYQKIGHTFVIIKSTNVNRKLALEELYIWWKVNRK